MASYESADVRTRLQSIDEVRGAFERLTTSMVKEHSDIQVMARTTSQVCCKKTGNSCSLDPDDCKVGIMGGGDTWAGSCGECQQPCMTDYDVCSRVSPRTCSLVGGKMIQLLERSDDFPIEAKIAALKDLNGALESGWPGFPIAERIPLFRNRLCSRTGWAPHSPKTNCGHYLNARLSLTRSGRKSAID